MADVHNKTTRSFNMSRIKSKNTNPELIVRRFLFSNGFRFRLHNKKLHGNPDITLTKYKTVIFVNGCFWHGHENCKYFVLPKTNTEWWKNKIERNKQRDETNKMLLVKEGWNVITIFECSLKKASQLTTLENVLKKIQANNF
jgi:DNA mismatch endonuclease (patch repair protein)